MSEKYNYCHIAELTDRGCKRAANEDWLTHFESPNGLVAVVCDGMGGHVGGQVASHTAIEAIEGYLSVPQSGTPQELIVAAMNVANEAILAKGEAEPSLRGMGSTCVMLIVRDGKVYVGSVGDSRVYLIRDHRIRQLTKDQSFVQLLVDTGTITAAEAEHHPRKNEITNALGLPTMRPATVVDTVFSPQAGDCFLLCSDGLSGMVSDKEICSVVSQQGVMSQQARVEELINRAKKHGGLDNITCQIVEFAITPGDTVAIPWWKRRLWWYVAAAVIAVIVCAAIAVALFMKKGSTPEVVPTEDDNIEVTMQVALADTTVYLPGIVYKKDLPVVRIVEDRGLRGVTVTPLGHKTAPVSLRDLTLNEMSIAPEGCVTVKYDDAARTHCTLQLSSVPANGTIVIKLFDTNKEHYSCFVLPVIVREMDVDNRSGDTAKKKKKPIDGELNGKKSTVAPPVATTDGDDTPATTDDDTDTDSATESNALDCTVTIPRRGTTTITVDNAEGQNTATSLHFPGYKFGSYSGGSWFSSSGGGSKLTITIADPSKVPADAKITITTDKKGETITLRIKKK